MVSLIIILWFWRNAMCLSTKATSQAGTLLHSAHMRNRSQCGTAGTSAVCVHLRVPAELLCVSKTLWCIY